MQAKQAMPHCPLTAYYTGLIQENGSVAITSMSEPFIESIALVGSRLVFPFKARWLGNRILYWVYDFQLAKA